MLYHIRVTVPTTNWLPIGYLNILNHHPYKTNCGIYVMCQKDWTKYLCTYIYIYQKLCKSLSPFSHFVSKVRTIHVCCCHGLYQNTPCTCSRLTLLCSHKFRQTLTLWQTARTRTNTIVPRSAVDSSYPKDAHQQVGDVLLKTARNCYLPAIMITRKKDNWFFSRTWRKVAGGLCTRRAWWCNMPVYRFCKRLTQNPPYSNRKSIYNGPVGSIDHWSVKLKRENLKISFWNNQH